MKNIQQQKMKSFDLCNVLPEVKSDTIVTYLKSAPKMNLTLRFFFRIFQDNTGILGIGIARVKKMTN